MGWLMALASALSSSGCGRSEIDSGSDSDGSLGGDSALAGGGAQNPSGGRASQGGAVQAAGSGPLVGGRGSTAAGGFGQGAVGQGAVGGLGQAAAGNSSSGRGGGTQGGFGQGAAGNASGGAPVAPIPPTLLRVRHDQPNKVDLLLMIDNSSQMGSKQRLLAKSLPSFIQRFVSPRCLDDSGKPTGESSQEGSCREGLPEFAPVRDLHIAVISSSLGDMGSGEACEPGTEEKDDKGWLIPSVRAGRESWNDTGFLNWDPDQRDMPAGSTDADLLSELLADHVLAAGERGCGYEATLESWYRFLIDPEPPETVTKDANGFTAAGPPSPTLLAQRAAFLRPDSVLAIVMVSDENDCSIIDYGQGWIVGLQQQGMFSMPRATSACAADPNSACCFSCSTGDASVPAGCPLPSGDPECQRGTLSLAEDHPNVRCFQQKRRFGFDLLQPTARYVQGLTRPAVYVERNPDQNGDGNFDQRDLVPNPLYASPAGIPQRDRSMVFLAGILGVPWQDVSDEASWRDDRALRYLRHDELVTQGRWDWILGSSPADGLMFESNLDRTTLSISQKHPAGPMVGGELAPSTNMVQVVNPINGHESKLDDGSNLQTACLFQLEEPIADCNQSSVPCNCSLDDELYNHAFCDGTTQTHGKAHPSTRQLEVLRGFGALTGNAVVSSICPKNSFELFDGDPDFAYRPALHALADRMKEALRSRCLDRPLEVERDGSVDCSLLEVTVNDAAFCGACNGSGRMPPSFDTSFLVERLGSDLCVCEVEQYEGAELDACRTELAEPTSPGFCYVDARPGAEQEARSAVVAGCPADARQILRLGQGLAEAGSTLYFACGAR
jgi:hypothetical protein